MRTKTAVLTTLLLAAATAHAIPELKGSPGELTEYLNAVVEPITLCGTSEVKAQANKAIVMISVETEADLLETALKSNQAVRKQVTDKLTKAGIDPNDIVASKFSSTPEYGFWSKKPKSYKVVNVVKIAVLDEKHFQNVAAVVDAHIEVEYLGVLLECSDEKLLKQQAIQQACDDLLAKKDYYEKKFGVKLKIQSFQEVPVGDTIAVANVAAADYAETLGADIRRVSQYVTGSGEVRPSFGEVVFSGRVVGQFILTKD